ncbi:MAG: hypothetical protein AAB551_04760 [Patescibacteria group bacterium]
MNQLCGGCSAPFEILEADLAGLAAITPVVAGKEYALPSPTLCTDCRQQRRLAFRNERKVYHRSCDFCKKAIISVYSPDKPYVVYCSECWWDDACDATQYGQDFDFSRPFFEQFAELVHKVPLLSNMVFNSVNSEYNGFCSGSKDCYLSSRIGDCENILYSYLGLSALGCIDCFDFFHCQYCYECVDCWNCYNSKFCQLSRNCTDCVFCYDCIGCKNCFGCVGLRNVEYYFFNKPCTKEEYEENVKKYNLGNYANLEAFKKQFYHEELFKKPFRSAVIINTENASGNYISQSKDIYRCFDVEKTDTARHSWGVEYAKDIYDCSFIYYGEHCYENISNSKSANIYFSFVAIGVHDLLYSMLCFNNTHDCFGCLSLKKQQYCILNKQYSKEEYEALVPRIIEHMKKTGEWGEFFSIQFSLFGYNESLAQEYFPLKKDQILAKGYRYQEEDVRQYLPQKYQIPLDIRDVPGSIISEILSCIDCGKNYKIIARELEFYQQAVLPIPRKCPDCRHRSRMSLRNPRKLYQRPCDRCGMNIETTYAPERPEKVYCEKCYLEGVY